MVSEKIKVRFIFRVNLCHFEQIKAFDRNFVFFKDIPGTVIKKKKKISLLFYSIGNTNI